MRWLFCPLNLKSFQRNKEAELVYPQRHRCCLGDPVLLDCLGADRHDLAQALGIESRATESFLNAMGQVGAVIGRTSGMGERLRSINVNPWTPDELHMLSTLGTADVTSLSGRSRESVEHARRRIDRGGVVVEFGFEAG